MTTLAVEGLVPLLLCSAIVVLASAAAIIIIVVKEGSSVSSMVYADDVWKPNCQSLHPSWLLGFRFVAFLYTSAILASDVLSYGFGVFYYYTQWSFLLLIIYFGMASLLSAKAAALSKLSSASQAPFLGNRVSLLKGNEGDDEESKNVMVTLQMYWETIYAESEELAPFSGFLMQIIFQTLAGAAVMTDAVYWLGVFPVLTQIPRTYDFLEINLHGVNLVLLLVDMFLNRMRFPWFRGAYFTLWTAVYVMFQWSVHALGMQGWPYPFMDPTQTWTPLWYLGLCVVHVTCYGLMCFIEFLKQHYLRCVAT